MFVNLMRLRNQMYSVLRTITEKREHFSAGAVQLYSFQDPENPNKVITDAIDHTRVSSYSPAEELVFTGKLSFNENSFTIESYWASDFGESPYNSTRLWDLVGREQSTGHLPLKEIHTIANPESRFLEGLKVQDFEKVGTQYSKVYF